MDARCGYCKGELNKSNRDFDGAGVEDYGFIYCNKLHRKYHEKELISSGHIKVPDTGASVPSFQSDSWINGTWEHITSEPITITGGRKELIEVCKKYNVMPKALLKPKSQGKGYEMKESSI